MHYGVYIFFALVQLTAALFAYFLLPETAGVPIEMVRAIALTIIHCPSGFLQNAEIDCAQHNLA